MPSSIHPQRTKPQRPGPKRLTTDKRPRSFPPQPLKSKARRSYPTRKKLEVLTYWATPSIPYVSNSSWESNEMRCPSIREVSQYFGGIPISCISDWRNMEDEIVKCAMGDRRRVMEGKPKWPVLETELYRDFLARRADGHIVRRGWFRITRWFTNFLSRYHISIRFTTNRAQKIPHDYLNLILEFWRFVRRNSQIRSEDIAQSIGRYIPQRVVNMDQTPAPFEYLSGRTYAEKGSNTVWAKAEKSGWDKRQATVQLTVLGDGTMLKPWILFKGKGQLPVAETSHYDPRVTIRFNTEGYANEEIILEWIQEQLLPVIHREISSTGTDAAGDNVISLATGLPTGTYSAPADSPGLVSLDAASFHKTPAVRKVLLDSNIIPCMIPGGCTSLIQVLDVSVNRSFKDFLKEAMENELHYLVQTEGEDILSRLDDATVTEDMEAPVVEGIISAVGLRRILLTRSVGAAWEKFKEQKQQESIRKTFRQLGLTLPIDGSCDSELSVKGLLPEELIIGDWQRAEPIAGEVPEEEEIEEEMDEEEDNNKDVFFVELEGSTVQVGRQKKKKQKKIISEPGQLLAKPRRQVTCSVCKIQGHNKRGCSQQSK